MISAEAGSAERVDEPRLDVALVVFTSQADGATQVKTAWEGS
jgi:hypothetical protein